MSSDRRENLRVPDNRLITEFVSDRPNAASVVNLSDTGIFTVKPPSHLRYRRDQRIIQLEIPVPEASESIWACGELVFERAGQSCVGSGIRFISMADFHRRLIRDVVEYRKQDVLAQMMREIKRRKQLAAYPSPFAPNLPSLSENTVRIHYSVIYR
jgi:hypothetical protein